MAINPISASTNSRANSIDPLQTSSFSNNDITKMLVGGNLDPKFATLLISQMSTNNVNSILFGDNSSDGSSDSSFDPFSGVSGGTDSTNDLFGVNTSNNYITPQFEMSVYSSLIGKIVTAKDPTTGELITGKVKSVSVFNGSAALDVNGISIPTSNLIKIEN